ncbi:MAG: hypothetical protein HYR60_00735 [Acidobacteria bacterium]|nr:hypothetical protein [Acidobacteriota bacterium]
MSRRFAFCGSVAIVVVSLAPADLTGQTPAAAKTTAPKRAGNPLRTPRGQPDLQGIWDFATITPLERPKELAGKEVLTAEEAAEFESRTLQQRNPDRRDGGAQADVGRAYNQFWWDYGTKIVGTRRTSLIVDPPDGRVPPLTPEAQKRADARTVIRQRPPAGPEDRNLWERCILGGNAGPPMAPGPYNNNVQLFQTSRYVVILNEMINDARIVPLDGRPHVPPNIRQWRGDSRGRWDGNTLVVDTRNFTDETNFRGATKALHVVERFTRVDAGTLLYEFTVDDPATWTRPWSAAIPMRKTEGPMFEYACHEGNYGMFNMLAGARAGEKAAEEAAKKGSR